MKLKLFAMVLVSGVALIMTSGYAAARGDDAMQQEGQTSGGMQEGAGAGGQQMSSDQIKQVQQALNNQGYDAGPVDGILGSKTQDAVKNFQQAKGMESSGQLDQQTLAALGVSEEGAAAGGGMESQPDSMESGAGAGGQTGDMESQPDSMESGAGAGGQTGDMESKPDNMESGAGAGGQTGDMESQPDSMESGAGAGGQEMSSDTIMEVEQALNQQGYDVGSPDGVMESNTQEAIKKFQEDKGLQASGQLDQQTLAALGVSEEGAAAGGGEMEEPAESETESGAGTGGQSSDMGSQPGSMSPGQSSEPGQMPGSSQ